MCFLVPTAALVVALLIGALIAPQPGDRLNLEANLWPHGG
jgi:hypothetical protein